MRERAAGAISGVLEQNVRLFSRIMNTLVKDKQIEDEWRKFERPISSRNLANQVEDEVVEALIQAARDSYPRISHRYYALKARWLGLERLEFWDRNAPLPEDADTRRPWADAKVVVLDAYRSFSPTLAEIVDRFFQGSWIDAQLRPGKDSGAFCHPTVPSAASLRPDELSGPQSRRDDPGARARPRRPPGPGRPAGAADGEHAADPGRDRLGVRRAADLPGAPGAGDRSGPAPGAARGQDRGQDQHGGAPDRLLRVRAPRPRRAPQGGADAGRSVPDLDGGADREPRPGLPFPRGLPLLLELHPTLHPCAILRLCLCLRRLPRQLALRRLRGAPGRLRAALSRAAARRRHPAPQGAAGAVRPRRVGSGLLGQGAGPARGADRSARGHHAGEVHDREGRTRPQGGEREHLRLALAPLRPGRRHGGRAGGAHRRCPPDGPPAGRLATPASSGRRWGA